MFGWGKDMLGRLLAGLMLAVLVSFTLALVAGIAGQRELAEFATLACQGLVIGFLVLFFTFLLSEPLSKLFGRLVARWWSTELRTNDRNALRFANSDSREG